MKFYCTIIVFLSFSQFTSDVAFSRQGDAPYPYSSELTSIERSTLFKECSYTIDTRDDSEKRPSHNDALQYAEKWCNQPHTHGIFLDKTYLECVEDEYQRTKKYGERRLYDIKEKSKYPPSKIAQMISNGYITS